MMLSESVEADTTDDLFLEAFLHTDACFFPDEDINVVDTTEREKHFFKQNLTQKASGACKKHSLPLKFILYGHLTI